MEDEAELGKDNRAGTGKIRNPNRPRSNRNPKAEGRRARRGWHEEELKAEMGGIRTSGSVVECGCPLPLLPWRGSGMSLRPSTDRSQIAQQQGNPVAESARGLAQSKSWRTFPGFESSDFGVHNRGLGMGRFPGCGGFGGEGFDF